MASHRPKRLPEAIPPRLAAEILHVSLTSIRRWIRKGYLKAYRVGPQMVRIPRSEIARMRLHRVTYIDSDTQPTYPKV